MNLIKKVMAMKRKQQFSLKINSDEVLNAN